MHGLTTIDDKEQRRQAKAEHPQEHEREAIPLELANPDRLFEELHGVPLDCRLLNVHAERYIVALAGEVASSEPIAIEVTVSGSERIENQEQQIREGIHRFFAFRAKQSSREVRDLLREGLRSLAIGVPILILCLLLSHYIKQNTEEDTLAYLVGENLLIPGWVANWKPIEIFLYSWWPVMRRRRLYRRLAEAEVIVRSA